MTVKMNLKPLERLVSKIERGSGPLRDVYLQWAARYRSYARRRFARAGRGGGVWTPLAESTKRARNRKRKAARGHKGPRHHTILRDTDTLFNALDPQIEQAGSLRQLLRKGIRVGYGGSSRHPKATRLTIARLAEIHHRGLGRVPARPIIVKPDKRTLDGMVRDLHRGLKRIEPWVR
jgi:hypothetical protein